MEKFDVVNAALAALRAGEAWRARGRGRYGGVITTRRWALDGRL